MEGYDSDFDAVDEPAPVDRGPIDMHGALPRFGYDQGFFIDMLGEFIRQMEERIGQLYAAVAAENLVDVSRLAHNVKGIASNFNAEPLTRYARETEEQAKAANPAGVREQIALMEAELPRIREFYQQVKEQ